VTDDLPAQSPLGISQAGKTTSADIPEGKEAKVLIVGRGECASRLAGYLRQSGRLVLLLGGFPQERVDSVPADVIDCIFLCGDDIPQVLSLLQAHAGEGRSRKKPIVIYCPNSSPAAVRAAVNAGAHLWLTECSSALSATVAMETALACAQERQTLESQVAELTEKLETQRLLAKAKGVIMRCLQVDEETAHRIVRKAARDRNLHIREVAREIFLAKDLLKPESVK